MTSQELMDAINLLSFYIGIKNLNENLSQNKASELLEKAVGEIHKHLELQDDKLNTILSEIKGGKYEKD